MDITIRTIPHKAQDYDTAGNWKFDANRDLLIEVSQLGDWRKESAIGVHELVETLICKHLGITQEMVDAFDLAWMERVKGVHPTKWKEITGYDEPGNDPKAPYYGPHMLALAFEYGLYSALGLKVEEVEAALDALEY